MKYDLTHGFVFHYVHSITRMRFDLLLQVVHYPLRLLKLIETQNKMSDSIFTNIFLNENACVLIEIRMKFVTKGPIVKKSALVQVMAWHQTGDKPLFETMLPKTNNAMMSLSLNELI